MVRLGVLGEGGLMSIAKYIVNWDELLKAFGGSLNTDEIADLLREILALLKGKGTQKVKALRRHIPAVDETYALEHTFETDILLTGITYSCTGWKYQDSWDLMVGDVALFEVFTKELGEHKAFNTLHYVPAGTPVKFLFNNDSGNSKIVWADIEYLDIGLAPATPPPTEDPNLPIDNPYDWLFYLRWEDNSTTDLDFHLYLDTDVHLKYSNKSYILDVDNQAHLNYDFTSHGVNGRAEEPEIMSVFGLKDKAVNLFVTNYNGAAITEVVSVEVYKKELSGDVLIETVTIQPNQITGEQTLYIGSVVGEIFTAELTNTAYNKQDMDTSYCKIGGAI